MTFKEYLKENELFNKCKEHAQSFGIDPKKHDLKKIFDMAVRKHKGNDEMIIKAFKASCNKFSSDG